MDDSKMLSRLESRDESVLSEIDSKYGRLIASVARNITRSPEDAEEIRNDVLHRLWESIPPSRPESVKSFAAMIARRLALNRVEAAGAKKRGDTTSLEELLEIASDGEISESIEAKELGAAINDFLALCRRDERVMFICRYVYAESPSEIAGALGITKNSLNVKLFRFRERLRVYLKERGYIE